MINKFLSRHVDMVPNLRRSLALRPFSNLNNLFEDSVIITKSCARRIKDLQLSTKNPNLMLRLAVHGGGCSGFQYTFKMDDLIDSTEDCIFEGHGSKVVVDKTSLDLVKGATVDYQQDLMKSAFAVVDNPQSESACGCGSSFAVKSFTQNPAVD